MMPFRNSSTFGCLAYTTTTTVTNVLYVFVWICAINSAFVKASYGSWRISSSTLSLASRHVPWKYQPSHVLDGRLPQRLLVTPPPIVTLLHQAEDSNNNKNNNNNNNDDEEDTLRPPKYDKPIRPIPSSSMSWPSSSTSFQEDTVSSNGMDEKQRMEIVRSLQRSFYKTVSSSTMNTITAALEEECSSSNNNNNNNNKNENNDPSISSSVVVDEDYDDDSIDECKIIDTDSPDSIIDVDDGATTVASAVAGRRYLDPTTGKFMNLPLWRVQWTEVPYRTNILSVHEPMYTNMFEEILRTENQPWYVGHLYLPGGSTSLRLQPRNLKTSDKSSSSSSSNNDDSSSVLGLQSWKSRQVGATDSGKEQSAVIGTLLRITDYRRLEDGKLLLFVQAVHRFVVTDVQQVLPYGIAHVQLLPDYEELLEVQPVTKIIQSFDEESVHDLRRDAIQQSFNTWHKYEFEETKLPLKETNFISILDVTGASLLKMVPFAFLLEGSYMKYE